jgi:cytochrome P450
MPAETPVRSRRKVERGDAAPGCPAHAGPGGVWKIQDYATARALLRATDTRQGGFGVENAARLKNRMRPPVLWRDGPEHREHRKQTAKYFTPRRVDSSYRALMERLADERCAVLRKRRRADLSHLSFTLAVAVAAEVVGLTDGKPGMARRIARFFEHIEPEPERRTPKVLWSHVQNAVSLGSFYWLDVRPSIRARRAARRDDLISHLIDEGCTNPEILGECVTFAAAGMVTTREFITLAAWQLFTDDDLRHRFSTGSDPQRLAILHEILRLDPVISDLSRWTTADVTAGDVSIPAGARVDISVAAANLDPAAMGADPGAVCPARDTADGVADAGLSFGDGAHRCPGAFIAIQETDIFLTRLLAVPGVRMTRAPVVRARPEIASYELVGLRLVAG